ncbi:MAG: outer membrane beta-barrel protein [Desulfobacterales bacterium]
MKLGNSIFLKPLTVIRHHCFCIAICLILLSASSATAYIGTFTPRLTLGTEYTDNVFQEKENKEDDFIYSFSPGFSFELIGKRSDASLSYSPSYRMYSDHQERSFWRHSALLLGKIGLDKNTTLNFQDSFLRTEDRLQLGNEGELQKEIFAALNNQEPYNQNRAGIWLTHQFGRNDSVFVRYDYNFLKNSDSDIKNDDPGVVGNQNFEDNSSHSPSFGLTYWMVPGQWGMETGGSYTRGQYDEISGTQRSDDFHSVKGNISLIRQFNRHLNGFVKYAHTAMSYDADTGTTKTTDYQVFNPSLGINYTFSDEGFLMLGFGYFFQVFDESEDGFGESDDESGFVAEIDLTKTWALRRTSINVNASSGYRESNLDAENLGFMLFYQGGFRVGYAFLKDLSGDITSSYQLNDYINFDREDTVFIAGLGLTYQVTQWVSSRAAYRFRSLKSTEIRNEFNENQVFFSITIMPPRPYRILP